MSNEDEWSLEDIPDLINIIIRLEQRLIDEQQNARSLLKSCTSRKYMYGWAIEEEDDRLKGNIDNAIKGRANAQQALVELTKSQIKRR